MTRGGATVSPVNIPAWRGFPLHDRLAEPRRGPHLRRQRRQGAGPRRGLAGRGAGASTTTSPWSCRPASAAASCSTAGCSTAPTATPGTSATSSSSPTGVGAAAAPVAASRPRRRAPPSPPSPVRPPAEAGPEVVRRTGTLVGRAVASVANLLDLRLAVVAGSVALGFGEPFFAAAQAELDRSACLDFSLGARDPARPARRRRTARRRRCRRMARARGIDRELTPPEVPCRRSNLGRGVRIGDVAVDGGRGRRAAASRRCG